MSECPVPPSLVRHFDATVQFSTAVKDLSVVLDSQLTMANRVAALSRSCFFLHPAAQVNQAVTHTRGNEDISVCLHQHSN